MIKETVARPVISPGLVRDLDLACPRVIPINNQLPLALSGSEEVAKGAFCRCFRTGSFAVKIHEYEPNGNSPEVDVDKITRNDRMEYEQLRDGPLSQFVTRTQFVIGRVESTNLAEIQIQPWVEGKVVGEIGEEEIWSDKKLLKELRTFGTGLMINAIKSGRWADYMGFSVKKECSLRTKFKARSLLAARNLIWDGEKLHLIDVTNHTWNKAGKLNQAKRNLLTFACLLNDLIRIEGRLKELD